MKIIDLLNKIANGEDKPKKIKYDNQVFEYREDMLDYYCYDYDLNLMGYQKVLNDEVEILEEEKKIPEKLEYYDDSIAWVIDGIGQLSDVDKVIVDKLNEVLDYLKSKGE